MATKEEINAWLESCPTKDFMIVNRDQGMWTIRVIIDGNPEKEKPTEKTIN